MSQRAWETAMGMRGYHGSAAEREDRQEGQRPLDELARVDTAHDVRTLQPCDDCGSLGNRDSMIDIDGEWFHGRCFVNRFGGSALAALPKSKQDRLMLGDIGVRLMRALCNHRSAK